MLPELERLSDLEVELVLKAPIITGILIDGAEGDVVPDRILRAIDAVHQNARATRSRLASYYQFVSEGLEDKLRVLLQSYPHVCQQRNVIIAQELAQLNQVFPRISRPFASELYKNLKALARVVARDSGPRRDGAVGPEVAFYLPLPMIKDSLTT